MHIREFKDFDVQSSASSFTDYDYKLLASLERFAKALKRHDIEVTVFSEPSLRQLPEISNERKLQTAEYFNNASNWIEPFEGPLSGDFDIEMFSLQNALDFYGLRASDEFLKTIKDGDVIEMYGPDVVQIYRSLSFYEMTGYSLLDLSAFEWYVLWDRPKKIMEMVGAAAFEALHSNIPVKDLEIPKHVLRETQDTGKTQPFIPRACLVEFKKIGSLTSPAGSLPRGLICTSKGQIIALGEAANDIQFV